MSDHAPLLPPECPRLPQEYRDALNAYLTSEEPVPIQVFIKARDAGAWLDYATERVMEQRARDR